MQETQVRSLGQEDPLEKEMTTHFSILAWEIPWTEEPGGLSTVHGPQRVIHDLATKQEQVSLSHCYQRQASLDLHKVFTNMGKQTY